MPFYPRQPGGSCDDDGPVFGIFRVAGLFLFLMVQRRKSRRDTADRPRIAPAAGFGLQVVAQYMQVIDALQDGIVAIGIKIEVLTAAACQYFGLAEKSVGRKVTGRLQGVDVDEVKVPPQELMMVVQLSITLRRPQALSPAIFVNGTALPEMPQNRQERPQVFQRISAVGAAVETSREGLLQRFGADQFFAERVFRPAKLIKVQTRKFLFQPIKQPH